MRRLGVARTRARRGRCGGRSRASCRGRAQGRRSAGRPRAAGDGRRGDGRHCAVERQRAVVGFGVGAVGRGRAARRGGPGYRDQRARSRMSVRQPDLDVADRVHLLAGPAGSTPRTCPAGRVAKDVRLVAQPIGWAQGTVQGRAGSAAQPHTPARRLRQPSWPPRREMGLRPAEGRTTGFLARPGGGRRGLAGLGGRTA